MAQGDGAFAATFDDDAFADFIDDAASPPASAPFAATFDDDAFADFASATPPSPSNAAAEGSREPVAPIGAGEQAAEAAPSPSPADSSAAEDERREFELQRQRRLELLEEQRKQQSASEAQPVSSQWGGWLSSMPTIPGAAMDLTSLQKLASEQAERAASAALTSPTGVASGLADIRGKLQSSAELLQIQSPVTTFNSFSKNLEGLGMASGVSSLSVSSLGAPSSMMANASSLMDMSKWGWGSAGSEEAKEPPGGGGTDAGSAGAAGASADTNGNGTSANDGTATGGDATKEVVKPKREKPKTEQERFDRHMEKKDYEKAAVYAANSPKQELRTLATIRRFQEEPPAEGGSGQAPILIYFGQLLKREGTLLTVEGLELARPVVQQGQIDLLNRWISEGKIEQTEALADVVREKDPRYELASSAHQPISPSAHQLTSSARRPGV